MCFTRVRLLSIVVLAFVFSSGSVLNAAECCAVPTAAPVAAGASIMVILGDVNQDGVVTLLDVGPFMLAVASGVYIEEADINTDMTVNIRDVDGFMDLMVGKAD